MTVESSVQDVTYETDGVTLKYAVPFYFLDNAHVYADFVDTAESSTSLVNGTDFSLTGAGDEDGGSLTLAATKAVGFKLHIYRIVPVTQEAAYQQNSAFPAKTTETALDKLTMIAQQLESAVENSIRYPLVEYGTDGTLPLASDRANTVLAFDSDGAQTLVPMPASVGAGDLRIEEWTAGVDFIAGTSNSVRLSRAYGNKANLGTVVMAGMPQDPATYVINDGDLQFDDVIPEGVDKIWCIGGTTLSLMNVGAELANIVDYGAVDGEPDSTHAFLAAQATGRTVYAPAGTFRTSSILWPTGSRFRAEGPNTIIKPIAGFTAQRFWTTSNANDVRLSDFTMDVSKSLYPNTIPLYFDTGDNVYARDVRILEGGYLGCYASNLTNSLAERVRVDTSLAVGMLWAGGSRNTFRACAVMGTDQSHGLEMQGGDHHLIDDCISVGAQGFGITSQGTTNSMVSRCRIHNSRVEAVTIGGDGGDGNVACDNIATWDAGVSEDFGMSCGANGSTGTFRNRFLRNTVRGCGKSGIALAADATAGWSVLQCEVSDNLIIDSNQLNLGAVNGGGAGVILYGATCSGNLVKRNRIIDTGGGKLIYGVFETQIGAGGYPQNNTIFDNDISGQSGVNVQKQGGSHEAFSQNPQFGYLSWSPTVTAGSGALSSVSVLNADYYEQHARIDFYVSIKINTNGTGASVIKATLPFDCSWGVLTGREDGVTGNALIGEVSGNILTVRTYNNGYPGADGAVITLAGFAFRTFS